MQFDKIISFFFILYENFLKKKKHEIAYASRLLLQLSLKILDPLIFVAYCSVMIVNLNDSCFCIKKYKLQR